MHAPDLREAHCRVVSGLSPFPFFTHLRPQLVDVFPHILHDLSRLHSVVVVIVVVLVVVPYTRSKGETNREG